MTMRDHIGAQAQYLCRKFSTVRKNLAPMLPFKWQACGKENDVDGWFEILITHYIPKCTYGIQAPSRQAAFEASAQHNINGAQCARAVSSLHPHNYVLNRELWVGWNLKGKSDRNLQLDSTMMLPQILSSNQILIHLRFKAKNLNTPQSDLGDQRCTREQLLIKLRIDYDNRIDCCDNSA